MFSTFSATTWWLVDARPQPIESLALFFWCSEPCWHQQPSGYIEITAAIFNLKQKRPSLLYWTLYYSVHCTRKSTWTEKVKRKRSILFGCIIQIFIDVSTLPEISIRLYIISVRALTRVIHWPRQELNNVQLSQTNSLWPINTKYWI